MYITFETTIPHHYKILEDYAKKMKDAELSHKTFLFCGSGSLLLARSRQGSRYLFTSYILN